METQEGGDRRLVLPTFQPTGRESGSIAVLSGLLCFKGGLAAISWEQTWKTDAPVWGTESRSYKKAEQHFVLGIHNIWKIVSANNRRRRKGVFFMNNMMFSDLSVLVEHAYHLVSDGKNVPPVKVGHARLPPFFRTVVQEVKYVFGCKVRVSKTVVHEVHHCWVSQGVLQLIETQELMYIKRQTARDI